MNGSNLQEPSLDSESLPQLFTAAERQLARLEELPSSESEQVVPAIIKQFETATKFVSILGLFSRNEKIEEIPTSDLRYLLLPAYLAKLTLKLNDLRSERLVAAEVYIKDFLQRCKDYEVPGSNAINERLLKADTVADSIRPLSTRTPQEALADSAEQRAKKIAVFKQKMESREMAAVLRRKVDDGTADEDIERKYYYNAITLWILDMVDEMAFVQEERRLLEYRARIARNPDDVEEAPAPSKLPGRLTRPVVIVRNELQKQVFGAGYPSLPLLTVDEFYQELVQEGALPAPGSKAAKNLNYMGSTQDELEADDVKKERDIEKDDPEHLRNARDYDDWKDDHRRGWGNRIGQG